MSDESVSESSGLIGQLSVTPSSGRLLAGQSTAVSVNVTGGLLGLAVPRTGGGVCVGCQLTINPGASRRPARELSRCA